MADYEYTSTGPVVEPEYDDEYFRYLESHHECTVCQEEKHEEALYLTIHGWMCIEHYNYLHTYCADEINLPQKIKS